MADSQILGNSLAVFSATVDAGKLFVAITVGIRAISAYAASNAAEMRKLKADAHFLTSLIHERFPLPVASELQDEAVALLRRIDQFVQDTKCRTRLHNLVEVFWTHEQQALQTECHRLKVSFILHRTGSLQELRHKEREDLIANLHARIQAVSEVPRLDNLELPEAIRDLDMSDITFYDDLSIGRGTTTKLGNVELRRLEDNLLSRKTLHTHRDIQQGAHVQIVHGIVEAHATRYAVLEDCSELPVLAKRLNDDASFGNSGLISRIQVAYDVAQSVAWLHEGGLVIKTLNDHSIALVGTTGDKALPKILDLIHVRHLYERTTSTRIDKRYEAPETRALGMRTKESDVWSLGIIVWQIITGLVPYNIDKPIDASDVIHGNQIRDCHIQQTTPDQNSQWHTELWPELEGVIRRCWEYRPSKRLRSMGVAEGLLDAIVKMYGPEEPLQDTDRALQRARDEIVDRDLGDAKNAALALVNQARQENIVDAKKGGKNLPEKSSESKSSGGPSTEGRKLDGENFRRLLSSANDPNHPDCAFLVGAVIFWELMPQDRLGAAGLVLPTGIHHAKSKRGRRAEIALHYLNLAAERNYEHSYVEIVRAHRILAQDFTRRIADNYHLAGL